MEDELTGLPAARRYERTVTRLDARNGYFRRWLTTELGAIERTVPRGPRAVLPALVPGAGRAAHNQRRPRPAAGVPARALHPRDGRLAEELTGVLSAAALHPQALSVSARMSRWITDCP